MDAELITERKDMYTEYAWKYFELHANQRIKMYQFFITIVIALLGGLGYLYFETEASWNVLLIGGILLSLCSYMFQRLDSRTRDLIQHAKDALRTLEGQFHENLDGSCADKIKIFCVDEKNVTLTKDKQRYYTYTDLFNLSFNVIFYMGILISMLLLIVPIVASIASVL